MNGSTNHSHYFADKQPEAIQKLIAECKLPWPCFIGQGLSKRVGSDCYGYYVVELKKLPNGKPLVGICQAKTEMHESWTDGSEDCSLDWSDAKPTEWLTTYGTYKPSGDPKWWYCDENGSRKNASNWHRGKAHFNWNGAYAYADPSFCYAYADPSF